ncbi:MAG: CoA pyrophosphatase [Chitinophagales bacterium]
MFQDFTAYLSEAFKQPLPGKAGQALLKPYLKINRNIDAPSILKPKEGAVMALIYPIENKPHLLFIERPEYDGVHSGQIAFPGGRIEKSDASNLHAALRETYEEVGIESKHIQVLGNLTEVFVFASNFMVYPYVGVLQEIPRMALEKNEVAGILEIPLSHFFKSGIVKEKTIKNALGFNLMAPYYDLNGKVLWGATAMMVSELCSIIQQHNIKV